MKIRLCLGQDLSNLFRQFFRHHSASLSTLPEFAQHYSRPSAEMPTKTKCLQFLDAMTGHSISSWGCIDHDPPPKKMKNLVDPDKSG
jgi:hypothetical protein